MNELEREIYEKYKNLKESLREMKRVLVAFSGGVDSTFLVKVARDVLGRENVLAITALSATTAKQERSDADTYAKAFGVEHEVIQTSELDNPEFTKNAPNKCYICKKSRFQVLVDMAGERGFHFVIDGENQDDRADYRPGSLASKELGVKSPLRDAGLTKNDIRLLSREFGLNTWDKPSFACLASRIPYRQEITPEKLRQVDEGEYFLRESGFSPQLRLRHHQDIARLELDQDDFAKLADPDLRARVVQYLKSLGFQFVTLDLEGYNMGSLNRSISDHEK